MKILSKNNRPKFKTPPVIEVSATAQFSELDNKSFLTDLDKIWEELGKEKYPTIEFKNRRGKLSNSKNDMQFSIKQSDDNFDAPCVWLTSKDLYFVVQIQPNRLSVNWRKVQTDDGSDYSSYEIVWEQFLNALNALSNFTKKYCKSSLEIDFLELAYINVINFNDFGGVENIQQCIPSITYKNIPDYLGQPNTVNFLWETLADKGASKFIIQGLTGADSNTGENLLRLDFIQKGGVDFIFDNDADKIHTWFNDAHLRIVNAFKDITSKYMHTEKWGIK